jgi:hypothetical protein
MMKPLTLNDLIRNAYRTLGLTAGASEADVDGAARRMRLWENPADIPATENDAPFLGPVRRTRQDIDAAVSRLADPEARVQERLWWFANMPPENDEGVAAGDSVLERHDAALAQVYRVLVTDANEASLRRWKKLMREFEALSTDDDYLAWLLEREAEGDFEKRATMEEVAAAQGQMAERLSLALAAAADWTLAGGDASAAAQVVQLLQRNAGAAQAAAPSTQHADPILTQLEERLREKCIELREIVDKAWETRQIPILRSACHRAINLFERNVKPIFEEAMSLIGDDLRRERAQQEVAALLVHVSEGYEAVYDFVSAERAWNFTAPYAKGTVLEGHAATRLEVAREAARRQRLGVPPQLRERGLGPG